MLETVETYRSLLDVRTRGSRSARVGSHPKEIWHRPVSTGEWREDERGVQNINEAIQALQNALEVYTRDSHSDDWMGVQSHLATRPAARCAVLRTKMAGRSWPRPFSYTEHRSKPSPRRPIQHAGRTSTMVLALHSRISANGPTVARGRPARGGVGGAARSLDLFSRDVRPSAWAGIHRNLGFVYEMYEMLGDRAPAGEFHSIRLSSKKPISNQETAAT